MMKDSNSTPIKTLLRLVVFLNVFTSLEALSTSVCRTSNRNVEKSRRETVCLQAHHGTKSVGAINRSLFFKQTLATALVTSSFPSHSQAQATEKQLNLSPDEIGSIVKNDVIERAFLTNGDLTRSIYSEMATFTDEIDTYKLDQWIKGTSKLFVPGGSRVSLVGDVNASKSEINFRFEEDLMFNIPFKPVVSLTGKVVLERDEDGLVKSYREFWDQDVGTVLKSAKFNK